MRTPTPMRTIVIVLLAAFIAQARFDSIIKEYRGVFIGTDRDQVHQKLGKPKNEYPGEDDFDVSETESVRVFFDDAKKVKAIVITYTGKLDAAPKPKDVIGESIEARPDGGMYKMVRVEDKGFWVSYVKTAGDNPSVMITVQSLGKST
jgi:hypothetical protein